MGTQSRGHAMDPHVSHPSASRLQPIAIIGMACRVPGADSPQQLWQNLCRGVASIHKFSDDELLAAGVPAELIRDPGYVKAAPLLADYDTFDAALFRYS